MFVFTVYTNLARPALLWVDVCPTWDAFQKGIPALLTNVREFVIKNFVLASARLVVGSKLDSRSEKIENRLLKDSE